MPNTRLKQCTRSSRRGEVEVVDIQEEDEKGLDPNQLRELCKLSRNLEEPNSNITGDDAEGPDSDSSQSEAQKTLKHIRPQLKYQMKYQDQGK